MMVIRAACILAALSAAAANHVRAEIPIGLSSALTGPNAWVSEPHLAGTELAIADLNAKGGILGEPLESIVVDDGCDAELAPLAAEKLVSAAVAVVFSATCSGAAIPASKVYRRAGIPMIEAGATNPKLTEAGEGVSSGSLVATIFRAISAAITWQTAGEVAISRLCTILRPMAKGSLRKSKSD
jgi:ABC-type branched-subunit amino acid transport system substrate-binding protein